MNAAPHTDATIPAPETAPDVPGGTDSQLVIIRGGSAERVPTSVPHVSAVAAASAPAPSAIHAGEGMMSESRAAAPKTPPFASTWTASRSFPLATTLAVRSRFVSSSTCDRSDDPTKKATSSAPQLQPAAMATVPRERAATAPPVPSAPNRRAARTMAAAMRKPVMARPVTDPRALGHNRAPRSRRRRSASIQWMRGPGRLARQSCAPPGT